ncbi:MAG: EamA family transporter [Thermoanaerobaculia bacterium]
MPAALNEEPKRGLARLEVLAAALLFSTGGTAIKLCSLSGWQVASARSGVAVVATLLGSALFYRRLPRLSAGTWLVGITYAATLVLFVTANKHTTAASAIFLQSTAPLYVLLLGPWLLREPIRRHDGLTMALMLGGLMLFAVAQDPAGATAPDPARGNLLAGSAGVTWAFTILGLRWLSRHGRADAGLGAVLAGNLLACLASLPFALPLPAASGQDLAVLVYLGAVQIALAYFFLTAGMKGVSAFEASLLLLLEPVASMLLSWAVHHERLSPYSLLGAALILAGTLSKAFFEARLSRRDRVAEVPGV